MIESIDHTEVVKYYEKKKKDVWFEKFLQFQEAMDLIFIMKTMNEEIHNLKKQIRELRKEETVIENPEDDYKPKEPKDKEDIYNEPVDLSFMDEEKDEEST